MFKEQVEYNNTAKPNSAEIERLRRAFPRYFDKQGNFLLDRFHNMLSQEEVNIERESHELRFLGKSYAKYLTSTKTTTVLTPDALHNEKPQNKDSDNIYIVGDNLDAMKHLLYSYSNEVDCIYMDPLYNTGSDGFVYSDSFEFTKESLSEAMGIDEAEAERVLNLSGKSTHPAWLTFMYPRLMLAFDLLSDNGVIFISIDENEHGNLRLLCDEIFGEENFAGEIIWKNSSKNDEDYISMQHEYIMAYTKNKTINKGEWIEEKEGLEEIFKAFEGFKKKHGYDREQIHKEALEWYQRFPESNPIYSSKHYAWMDERGVYFDSDLSGPNYGQYRYDVIHPVTEKVCKEPASGWRYSEETMKQRIAENLIHFGKDETTIPKNKTYLKETTHQSLTSIKYKDGRGASNHLEDLLGGKYFTNPKDVGLLMSLFSAIGLDDDALVLDIFSGSGTTAEAVMELNARDGKNLRYIMVQIAEIIEDTKPAYEAGYRTIDEIGCDRIEKAAIKIKKATDKDIDYGYKRYCINEVSDKTLDKILEFDPSSTLIYEDMTQNFEFDGMPGRDTILLTWMNMDGYGLTSQAKKIRLHQYEADIIEDSIYIIDQGLAREDIMDPASETRFLTG